MRRKTIFQKLILAGILGVMLFITADAHDLFLKLDSYVLQPDSKVMVRLLNGTFRSSDNAVSRERMNDVSLVSPSGNVTHPPDSAWQDEGKTSLLRLQVAEAGTYVVGLSTKPREIALEANDFNAYLAQDGLPDILAARKQNQQLDKDARERYSKHVKAIFQAGGTRTETFKRPLGYPVEIIPQQNPYGLKVGQTLDVLCIKDGQPLANQFVLAGYESKPREISFPGTRTDENGVARISLKSAGKWYVKFIHMMPRSDPQLNYESQWASLTFEIRPG